MRATRIFAFVSMALASLGSPIFAAIEATERIFERAFDVVFGLVDRLFKVDFDLSFMPSLRDVAVAGVAPAFRHGEPEPEAVYRLRGAPRNC